MAHPEHLEILKQGVEVWNKWRQENPKIRPNLGGSIGSRIFRRIGSPSESALSDVDLSGANLENAILSFADLSNSRLRKVNFRNANLLGTSLKGADLWGANFFTAYAERVDLSSTNLGQAELRHADFTNSDFSYADVSYAYMGHTILEGSDLSFTRGLDLIIHDRPSILGVSTIYKSQGKIPEEFLRNCGMPESFIAQIPTLITSIDPIQFHSCFISYSSKDQEFADCLHSDLQAKGVRVWFAPHDMPIGARLRPTIDESIRVYDKLLLVLSEHSVSSQWVEQEVETALRKERQGGGTVLFPIRLDDSIFEIGDGWPALVKDTRNVGDFTRWKEHDSYWKAFDRLLRDLKAGA